MKVILLSDVKALGGPSLAVDGKVLDRLRTSTTSQVASQPDCDENEIAS